MALRASRIIAISFLLIAGLSPTLLAQPISSGIQLRDDGVDQGGAKIVDCGAGISCSIADGVGTLTSLGVSGLTVGGVLFGGAGGGIAQDATNLFWDDSNDRLGIGSAVPEFRLHLGVDGGIMSKGTISTGATLTTTGTGVRMFWYPRKAAFRAGRVQFDATVWNDANIGLYSAAFGLDTKASGQSSVAFGDG